MVTKVNKIVKKTNKLTFLLGGSVRRKLINGLSSRFWFLWISFYEALCDENQ